MASGLLEERLNQGDTSELANLLQDKLYPPSQPENRGLHTGTSEGYGAKRNLNDILEGTQTAGMEMDLQDNSSLSRFTRKGDMTLTSASLYGQAGIMSKIKQQQMGMSGPTPPSSQTATPDFSQHFTNTMQPNINNPATQSGITMTNTLDTPSSLDALSGQDSRESMVDPLFNSLYDHHTDMGPAPAPMDMITNHDFNFGHWEMPQIASDAV